MLSLENFCPREENTGVPASAYISDSLPRTAGCKWVTHFTGTLQDIMLKLQSAFSEEELDGDSLDTDELGFTHHISVETTMGNEESFLLSNFTEVYKLQCFESHQTYSKLSHSVLCVGSLFHR